MGMLAVRSLDDAAQDTVLDGGRQARSESIGPVQKHSLLALPNAVESTLGLYPYDPLNPTQVPVYAWPVIAVLLGFSAYVVRRRVRRRAE